MLPLVSVIMGVYNIDNEALLRKSVMSVLNQTFANFEFIICDDGSQNNTFLWLQSISQVDKRIVLLKNESNKGLAYTLNKCLTHAKGEFIARQDADDLSQQDRFIKQVEFLLNNPDISFVASNCNLYDERGVWGARVFPYKPEPKDFLFKVPFQHGALMFRRNCLAEVGGYHVSKRTRRTEDYDLLMRLYANKFRGANLQEYLYDFLENKAAMKRRKYKYRIDEAITRYKGFKLLGLMPKGIPYVIKPLIVGLIPMRLLNMLKMRYYKQDGLRGLKN